MNNVSSFSPLLKKEGKKGNWAAPVSPWRTLVGAVHEVAQKAQTGFNNNSRRCKPTVTHQNCTKTGGVEHSRRVYY